MWNLAFYFTIKHREAAFKAYYAVRSFITFNGIFMGPGYDLGDGSLWRTSLLVECMKEEEWDLLDKLQAEVRRAEQASGKGSS